MNIEAVNTHWYELPEKWLDADDIDKRGKWAIEILKDMIVNRHVEYSRFRKLFFRSLTNPIVLLPRQQQALDLATYARLHGLTETTYISEQLSINRHSAYKLLKRAEERFCIIAWRDGEKMETFDDSVALYHEGGVKIELSRADIMKEFAGLSVTCPTQPCNTNCYGVANARYGLCSSCKDLYGTIQEERDEWVQALVRDVRREAYAQAKQNVFMRKYGAPYLEDVA